MSICCILHYYVLQRSPRIENIFKSWIGVLTGAIATAGVLLAGLVSFKQGNFNRSQMFMRARVGFQAATVALMVGTVYVEGMGKS